MNLSDKLIVLAIVVLAIVAASIMFWSKMFSKKEYIPNKSGMISHGGESIAIGVDSKPIGQIPCPPATLLTKEKQQ